LGLLLAVNDKAVQENSKKQVFELFYGFLFRTSIKLFAA
jgi:hypothetical protein